MSKTIPRSDEVINRLFGSVFPNDCIQFRIIGIGKEYRFDIRIVHTNVLHTVFFLITTGKLMLLDDTVHIVRNISAYYQSILSFPVHGLGVNIIVFLAILHQPAFILKQPEVFGSFLINTFIVFIRTNRKVNLGLNDMIKGFFISSCFCTRFF